MEEPTLPTDIHITDWPVEIPRSDDGEHWELVPETWAPEFAANIYHEQARAHVREPGSSPVPMSFRWERKPV